MHVASEPAALAEHCRLGLRVAARLKLAQQSSGLFVRLDGAATEAGDKIDRGDSQTSLGDHPGRSVRM